VFDFLRPTFTNLFTRRVLADVRFFASALAAALATLTIVFLAIIVHPRLCDYVLALSIAYIAYSNQNQHA
jgi:hypothetical protein